LHCIVRAIVPACSILKKTYAYLGVELYNEKVHHKDMIYKVSEPLFQ